MLSKLSQFWLSLQIYNSKPALKTGGNEFYRHEWLQGREGLMKDKSRCIVEIVGAGLLGD